uniref:Uncharacterized protein n=1 Tax=Oryza meridionalis TaxID=40149 RepID=A0A0E0CM39_9ORYZ
MGPKISPVVFHVDRNTEPANRLDQFPPQSLRQQLPSCIRACPVQRQVRDSECHGLWEVMQADRRRPSPQNPGDVHKMIFPSLYSFSKCGLRPLLFQKINQVLGNIHRTRGCNAVCNCIRSGSIIEEV